MIFLVPTVALAWLEHRCVLTEILDVAAWDMVGRVFYRSRSSS